MKQVAEEDYGITDLENTEKMVMIGDQLTTDVMFGNINNMVSIWVTKYKDKWKFRNAS